MGVAQSVTKHGPITNRSPRSLSIRIFPLCLEKLHFYSPVAVCVVWKDISGFHLSKFFIAYVTSFVIAAYGITVYAQFNCNIAAHIPKCCVFISSITNIPFNQQSNQLDSYKLEDDSRLELGRDAHLVY